MITINGVDPQMIANNLTPYEPMHPGELLKEEIEHRGISQRKIASQMGVSYTVLNEVLNAKRSLTTEYALLFEATLGIESGLLLRMQLAYNVQIAKKDEKLSRRLNEIRKVVAML